MLHRPDATLAELIGAIGDPEFPAVAAHAVTAFMGFDLTALVFHARGRGARLVFDNFGGEGRGGLETYVAVTHELNPMLARGGAVRARDFAIRPTPDAPARRCLVPSSDEELGFRTLGWPERQEEIGLYFEAGGGVFELGCYRARGRAAAPEAHMRALQGLCAPVAAAFDRHVRLVGAPSDAAEALSPREREVTQLLLAGCSSEAIALRLGISRYTVKDHRKRIFRKLRIGSLAELFASGRRVLN